MKKTLIILMLLLCSANAFAQSKVVGLEYWFDENYSQKFTKTVTAVDANAVIVDEWDIPSVSNGMHRLSVRFKDNTNRWSAIKSFVMFKASTSASAQQSIIEMEYWVDGDYGKKITKSVSVSTGIIVESLDLPSINNGFHRLSVRFKDNNELWSAVNTYYFFKAGVSSDAGFTITKYRYWFDSDTKNVIEESVSNPSNEVSVYKFIDLKTSSPDEFPLALQMQFLDNTGIWSAVYTKTFFPEPDFEVYSSLNVFSFKNTSNFSRKFLWKFGDGGTDTTANPKHTYKLPGVYTVTLKATNSKGSRDTQYVVEVKGLREVIANKAGNTGDASILVYGGGFSKDAKVWLEGPMQINADTSYIEQLDAVYARFDLRGKTTGLYDVLVQFPGDTVMKLPKSFTIEPGSNPQPYVNVAGRNRILFGRWQSYQLNIGNKGNVDASGVPLFLVVSKANGLELDFKNLKIAMAPKPLADGLGYLLDSIPLRYELDELFGEPFDGYVYVFYIPSIPANSNTSIDLRIKTDQSFKMYSWMNESYFRSPFDDAVAECINEAIAWYVAEKGLDLGLKFIPGAGCLKNIGKESYGMMTRVIERKIGKDENGKSYKGFGEKLWGWGNWLVDMTAIGVGCALDVFPPTKAAKFAYASYKTIIELNKIKKDIRKLSNVDAKCREKFKHLSKNDQSVSAVNSFDPNELVGPSGFKSQKFTNYQGKYGYTIFFENKSTATAPAQEVVIVDTLDKTMYDFSTFALGRFSYSGKTNQPLSNLKHFTVDIDSVRNKVEFLRVNASFDTVTGIIRWQFITLHPATMDYPEDPDAGFLPPNKTSPEGEGFVSFTISVKQSLKDNDSFLNRAKIVFDLNEPIFTNTHSNTLDITKPTSKLTSIQYTPEKNKFRFYINTNDALSGVRNYTIYASKNDSAYVPVLTTSQNPFYIVCDEGVTYKFFSIAEDSVGNIETMKSAYDVSTLLVSVEDRSSLPDENTITIYPNPATSDIIVQYTDKQDGLVEFSIHDLFGRSVQQVLEEFSVQGINSMRIDVKNLTSGLYFLTIKTNTGTMYKKLIIAR